MSARKEKKLRREYREQAKKDSKKLYTWLSNKSFLYRFQLAMKILFRLK